MIDLEVVSNDRYASTNVADDFERVLSLMTIKEGLNITNDFGAALKAAISGVLSLMLSFGINAETNDRPAGFVNVATFAPEIMLSIRYASADNFLGRVVEGYEAPSCWLVMAAAEALKQAHLVLEAQGLGLIVFDCYRPQRAVQDFVSWALTKEASQKAAYFPRVPKSELFAKGYIARHSSHSRGATVDVGIVRSASETKASIEANHEASQASVCQLHASQDQRAGMLDFGSSYDCFDVISHTKHPTISAGAKANRELLVETMSAVGFSNYQLEWWHFTLDAEPYPTVYFDFPVLAQ